MSCLAAGDERDVTEELGTNWGRSDMFSAEDLADLQPHDELFITASVQLVMHILRKTS